MKQKQNAADCTRPGVHATGELVEVKGMEGQDPFQTFKGFHDPGRGGGGGGKEKTLVCIAFVLGSAFADFCQFCNIFLKKMQCL